MKSRRCCTRDRMHQDPFARRASPVYVGGIDWCTSLDAAGSLVTTGRIGARLQESPGGAAQESLPEPPGCVIPTSGLRTRIFSALGSSVSIIPAAWPGSLLGNDHLQQLSLYPR